MPKEYDFHCSETFRKFEQEDENIKITSEKPIELFVLTLNDKDFENQHIRYWFNFVLFGAAKIKKTIIKGFDI